MRAYRMHFDFKNQSMNRIGPGEKIAGPGLSVKLTYCISIASSPIASNTNVVGPGVVAFEDLDGRIGTLGIPKVLPLYR